MPNNSIPLEAADGGGLPVPASPPPSAKPEVTYNFTVRGRYPDGNKARMSGTLRAPDGYPYEAYWQAVKTCQNLTPGLIVDMTQGGQVLLYRLKGKLRVKHRK